MLRIFLRFRTVHRSEAEGKTASNASVYTLAGFYVFFNVKKTPNPLVRGHP